MPRNAIWNSAKLFLLMTLVTGVIYPLFITVIAQVAAREKANGSILYHEGKAVGSKLIGQKFSRNNHFWPRPSANDYNALDSGGSNLGPTSRELQKAVNERKARLAKAHAVSEKAVPRDLLFASGSGLDPHISVAAANFQLNRVLKARGLNTPSERKRVEDLIKKLTRSDLTATPHVNVLLLNKALDEGGQ